MENKEELVYEVEALERLKNQSLKRTEGFQREYDLIKGTILGVLFGIAGNFLVQFLYPVAENWTVTSGFSMSTLGVMVSIATISVIAVIILLNHRNQKRLALKITGTQADVRRLEMTIQKRKQQIRDIEKWEEQQKSAEESHFMMEIG